MPLPPDQIELLYKEHSVDVLGYLARRCPAGCADDLLQETFLQIVRQSGTEEAILSPRAWIFGIARNVLARYYRDRPDPVEAMAPKLEAQSESTEDFRIPRMREAITQLPSELRETLDLRIEQELSYEEIAAVLKIPVGTVRSRLHHAVRRLRAALSQSEKNQ